MIVYIYEEKMVIIYVCKVVYTREQNIVNHQLSTSIKDIQTANKLPGNLELA